MSGRRSSRPDVVCKKGPLKNFPKIPGKQLCQSLFFNKVAGLRLATLLKKRLWHRCFPANFVKFPRTPFLQNTSGRLLLWVSVIYVESMFPCYFLPDMKVIRIYYLFFINPCKFIILFILYFPNNLKGINHILGYIISCKSFFQQKVTP